MFNLILYASKFFFLFLLYLFLLLVLRAILRDLRQKKDLAAEKQTSYNAYNENSFPRLILLKGGVKPGQIFTLGPNSIIGRSPQAEVRMEDTFTSYQHARIYKKGELFLVEDLGSTNGTLLNGRRVTRPTKLSSGDKIRVGKTTFKFVR